MRKNKIVFLVFLFDFLRGLCNFKYGLKKKSTTTTTLSTFSVRIWTLMDSVKFKLLKIIRTRTTKTM